MITVGDTFPSFALPCVYGVGASVVTTKGNKIIHTPPEPSHIDKMFTREYLRGGWFVFVAWPKDFTFVCPTEILGYEALRPEFETRGTTLIGLSTDSDYVHLAWRRSREDLDRVGFPWLSDIRHDLSKELGILADGVCMRATIIVDPSLVVRHVTVNDGSVGRNPEETLRVLDALRTGELTPCGWAKGDPTL